MADNTGRMTVSTRVDPETEEKAQMVADAHDVSKSQYFRQVLKERLEKDHGELTDTDELMAEINELERKIERDDLDDRREGGVLPDPLGIFK